MRILNFSSTDPFEVAFFRVTMLILRFLKLWPLDPITRSTAIMIGINLSVLLTAIIGEIRFTWLIRREPEKALVAICPCLTKIVTWIKLASFVIYRKEFAKLLKDLQQHLRGDTHVPRKIAIIGGVSFFTNLWSMWLIFFGLSSNGFYTTKPIIFWAYQRYMGDNSSWIGLPFEAALPYRDMTQVQNKYLYSFVYCFLAYSGNVTIFGFPACDGAFMCFCMYISASQQCLHDDFQQTLKRFAASGIQRNVDDRIYNELSRLVMRQQNILLIFKRFNGLYKFMIFGHFFFAAIVLGIVLVNFLLTSGISKTIYVLYCMGACSQLYTYCYGAEHLNEQLVGSKVIANLLHRMVCVVTVGRINCKSTTDISFEMGILFFSPSDPFKVGFFRMPKLLLRFLGIWPLDGINKFTAILIGINLIVLLTAIIGEIRFTWLIRKEPIVAFVAVCPCLTKVVTCFKLMSYLNYRKKFTILLKQLQTHLFEDSNDSRKNSLIARISFLTAIWSLWLLFIGLSANGFYTTKPIIFWSYQRYMGDNSSWISLPFQAALPYMDMTRVQNKGVYALVFCFLAYSGNVNIFGFPAVDGAFMCFCMYISVSQQCLHEDYKRAFKGHGVGSGDQRRSGDTLYKEISRLVKRHQNILLMFERLNGLYKFMIFGHFFFAAIVLGVVLLNVLLSSGISKTVYVFYAIGASSQLYTYCYGAEMLNENCIKISDTIYFCPWYECDKKVQKLILFVMIKSQRGCLLQAPFFTPSIPLFGAIMKTSASYITLLNSFL